MFSQILIAAIVALPLAAAGSATACARTYTVVEGDTCFGISAAQNVSTYQLATLNPGVNLQCTNLQIGQRLCLGQVATDCATTYVVAPGDTCLQIMSRIGVNATILYANNPQINQECTNIDVGEVLCSLNVVRVPPASGLMGLPSLVSPAPGTATAAPAATHSPATNNGDDSEIPFCDELDAREWEW